MSSSKIGCKGHQRFCGGEGTTRWIRPALKIPVLLMAVLFLSGTSITLAQCQVHEDAKLTATDTGPVNSFGDSVSVSGDVAVVGAANANCAPRFYCGAAYVYRFSGSTWVQEAKLSASDATPYDKFGNSVSVSGDVAVVGAYGDRCPSGGYCGSAYVYRFNGSAWVEEQKLTASDAARNDQFGWSVSVSGDVAVVGAYTDDCPSGDSCGSAYVYRFNGSAWVEEQKLTASDAAAGDNFGGSVSVSANVVVVGTPWDDCAPGVDCGSAYVYRYYPERPVGNRWVQEQKLTAFDAAAGDNFGVSVSVSANVAVVGAGRDDCQAGIYCGSAYVYRFNGSNWVQQGKLAASDTAPYRYFGRSVSVSGNTAVVGTVFDYCGVGPVFCSSAYVYRFDGSTWVQQAKLTASDAVEPGDFSRGTGNATVSVSGDIALLGHRYEFYNEWTRLQLSYGLAYVYSPGGSPCDCNHNGIPDDNDIDSGRSRDCDGNGVPDECDVDCNHNGRADACEIGACCIAPTFLNWCAESTLADCELIGGNFLGPCAPCLRQAPQLLVEPGGRFVHVIGPPVSCSGSAAQAAAGACNAQGPYTDAWVSPEDARMCYDFGAADTQPIPAGFFGPGSDPFNGVICLKGTPLGRPEFGEADTLIQRTGDPFDRCELPSLDSRSVEIQIASLSLASVNPVRVTYDGGTDPQDWNVAVDLSPSGLPTGTPTGALTATKTHCNGGTYTSVLNVQPRFTFTKVGSPQDVRTLDAGLEGMDPVRLDQQLPYPWVADVADGLMVDRCSSFHPGIQEIQAQTACDCNVNLIRDKCDIESGVSKDCNENTVPDECDLVSGRSRDRNGNSMPDECDVRSRIGCSTAPMPQGILAVECQGFDCDGDADVDLLDFARFQRTLGCAK